METPPFPNKKYQVIYADPPWQYTFPHTRAKPTDDYPTMPTTAICQFPIGELAADNCTLFMWAIWNRLDDALKVIKAWGFEYKTCAFTWVKKKGTSLFWGMGQYTRQNVEICLLATKGRPKPQSHSVHQVIYSQIREHSRKPDEARIRIVELMGDIPRVELFARQAFQGWDVWGNEIANAPTQTLLTQSLDSERLTRGFQASEEAQIPAGTSESPNPVMSNKSPGGGVSHEGE